MVTFETKVWENDWEYILSGHYMQEIIKRCQYNFTKKIVIINNVSDIEKVTFHAKKLINRGIIDEVYSADNYANQVLDFFNLEQESFKGGYRYSISELVSIYLCETPFLLHFAGDSYMAKNQNDWISNAIAIIESDNQVSVANASWDRTFNEPRTESNCEFEAFFKGYGFSDQCFFHIFLFSLAHFRASNNVIFLPLNH
jgi:hypothetical protein